MKHLKVWAKQEIKYSNKRYNMKYRLAELCAAFKKKSIKNHILFTIKVILKK